MKVYFAFRSGYERTTRYTKVFEAKSVLDWFQSNWDMFQGEYLCEKEILGVHVYGFPIEDSDLDSGQKIPAPKSLTKLKLDIETYIYSNEVKVNTNCVQICTDDDEIELSWYVFDEIYAEKFPEKVAIWTQEYLPQTYGNVGKLLANRCIEIVPKGNGKGCIYYGSASCYDSGNIDSLEGLYKINNVRLDTFLNYLRNSQIRVKNEDDGDMGLYELSFIKFVAQQLPNANFNDILEYLGKVPMTEFNEDIDFDNFEKYTLNDILAIEKSEDSLPDSSFIRISEHMCEWNTATYDNEFHNYFVLFDDLWVEKNEIYAKNLARFTKTWEL